VKPGAPKQDILRRIGHHLSILWRSAKKFDQDHGFFLASGITFNILIYLVPFTLLLLAMVGKYLYDDQEVIHHIRSYLRSFAPSIDPAVMKNLFDLVQNHDVVGFLGVGALVWVSTMVFSALRTALNMVFHVEKGRTILRGLGIDLLMIFLAGVLLLLSMVLTSLITLIQEFGERLPFVIPVIIGPTLRWVLKYLLPFGFTYLTFSLIYKIIPNTKVHTLSALKAALFASLGWETAKHLFGWYTTHLSRYSVIYGSLSTLIIFFFWVYYSAAILLVGGEFACLLDREKNPPAVHPRKPDQKETRK
jgi:YihY family inner membrane protein